MSITRNGDGSYGEGPAFLLFGGWGGVEVMHVRVTKTTSLQEDDLARRDAGCLGLLELQWAG